MSNQAGPLALGRRCSGPLPAAKITALGTGVVDGGAATAGTALLTATSTTPGGDHRPGRRPADRGQGRRSRPITLPDGKTMPGVVASVGTVATTSSSGSTSVTVEVALADPKVAGHLNQAPATVAITTGSLGDSLVVPVNALLARARGGYAVEVTGPHGHAARGAGAILSND